VLVEARKRLKIKGFCEVLVSRRVAEGVSAL